MKIYDITLPVSPALAAWPGDAPYCWESTSAIKDGATVNLGAMSLSVHFGTHVDAPYHYDDKGATVDAIDPTIYIGAARVVDMRGKDLIRQEDFAAFDLSRTPRLLLKTEAWTNYAIFPETVPLLERGLPAWLAAQGVILLGIDVPSVDAIDSKDMPLHHELGAAGIYIVESLTLAGVPEGVYELIALPLRVVGADGSPIRALLREID